MSLLRRSFLQTLLGGGVALSAQYASAAESASEEKPYTFAFLTDVHIRDDRPEVIDSVKKLIDSIQARPEAPDLILFGGDNVFDVAGGQTEQKTAALFKAWQSAVMDRLSTPMMTVIGNHDIHHADHDADNPDAYGEKQRAIETYKMPSRYFRKEQGGWSFYLLDTFQRSGCELDEAQWKWLEEELTQHKQPTCIVTHAPLFSATHFFEPSTDRGAGKGYNIPSGWSVQHLIRFRELFQKNPHVKLCLSGHMHTIDRVEVDRTTYICGGAVSGDWWGSGTYLGFQASWMEFKIYPNGRWSHEQQILS
ncbi:hypothetical protein GC197_07900 [bacterium]|nr:hypothetical protein [bacterium]